MFKKVLSFMVFLTMMFATQTNVWAAAIHTQDQLAVQDEIIQVANPQMDLLKATEPFQMAAAKGIGGMDIQPWFWALSIVVSGLGQFLMGDILKGILFFLAPVILFIVLGIVGSVIASAAIASAATAAATGNLSGLTGAAGAAAGGAGIFTIVGYVIIIGIYAWNVIDAFFMNQDKMKSASLEDQMKAAQELQDKLQGMMALADKAQLITYEHGASALNYRLSNF